MQCRVQLTDDHPNKGFYCYNLGLAHHACYNCLGELTDLDKAATMFQKVVELTPDDDPLEPLTSRMLALPMDADLIGYTIHWISKLP